MNSRVISALIATACVHLLVARTILGTIMHAAIAILYGFTIWLACVAYTAIVYPDWAGVVAALCPLIVSAATVVALALDLALLGALWLFRRLPRPRSPRRGA